MPEVFPNKLLGLDWDFQALRKGSETALSVVSVVFAVHAGFQGERIEHTHLIPYDDACCVELVPVLVEAATLITEDWLVCCEYLRQ